MNIIINTRKKTNLTVALVHVSSKDVIQGVYVVLDVLGVLIVVQRRDDLTSSGDELLQLYSA